MTEPVPGRRRENVPSPVGPAKRGSRRASGAATLLALWLAIALCATVWVSAQRSTDRVRARWPQTYPLLFIPSGQYLRATAFGYDSVMADLLYLWSIQFYGHSRRNPDARRWLEHIYDVITDLDPSFIDAYLIGALIMSNDMGDPQMALRLLDKGMATNPDEWILPLEAGYTAYMNIGDYAAATEYFDRVARMPRAPDYAARLKAHMYQMRGDLRTAFSVWWEIYEAAEAANDERVEGIAWNHVYDLRVTIDIREIMEARDRFLETRGRLPMSLQELVRAGHRDLQLENPNGVPYEYDPETGDVTDPDAGARQRSD